MPTIWSVFSSGLLADRPVAAADNRGYFYLATDDNGGTLYHSDGSTWLQAAGSVAAPLPSSLEIVSMTGNLVLDHAGIFVVVAQAALDNNNTLTLPLASTCPGQFINTMSDSGSSINRSNIIVQGSDQLLGSFCSLQLLSSGINWYGMDC